MDEQIRDSDESEVWVKVSCDKSYKVQIDNKTRESGVTEKLCTSDMDKCQIRKGEDLGKTAREDNQPHIRVIYSEKPGLCARICKWHRFESWIKKRKWILCSTIIGVLLILCIYTVSSSIHLKLQTSNLFGEHKGMEDNITANSDKISTHETEVIKLKQLREEFGKIYEVETNVTNLQKELTIEKDKIQNIEKELEKIESIEKQLTTQKDKIGNIEKEVEKIENLERELKTQKDKIQNIEKEMQRIKNLEQELKTQKVKIQNIENEVGKISNLEREVGKLTHIEKEVNKIQRIETEVGKISTLEQTVREIRPLEYKVNELWDRIMTPAPQNNSGCYSCFSSILVVMSLLFSVFIIY